MVIFTVTATASKFCSENGTWWRHPDLNLTWTNYTLCGNGIPSQDDGHVFVNFRALLSFLSQVHIPVIKAISQVGYSVSLTLLLIACILLGSVRRLRCPRNNLHLQLFASFILRASVSLIRDLTYGSSIEEVLFLFSIFVFFFRMYSIFICHYEAKF
ncbi:UNVERIFIED_CONTAM: Parathyroid hormone/parathyroid hormone-related peptide receptor [Trichonephila clavipes]